MSVPTPSENGRPALDSEAIEDLLDVLDDVLVWRLAPARWERVTQILDTIAEAVAAGDLATLRDAITELELAGPVRILRIGAGEVVPVPTPVRDRANHLVHALRTGQAPSTGGQAEASRVPSPEPGGPTGAH